MFPEIPPSAMESHYQSTIAQQDTDARTVKQRGGKRRYSKRVLVGTFVVALGITVVGGVFWGAGAAGLQGVKAKQARVAGLPDTVSPFHANSEAEVSEILKYNSSVLGAKSDLASREYSASVRRSRGMIAALTGMATLIWVLVIARRQRAQPSPSPAMSHAEPTSA